MNSVHLGKAGELGEAFAELVHAVVRVARVARFLSLDWPFAELIRSRKVAAHGAHINLGEVREPGEARAEPVPGAGELAAVEVHPHFCEDRELGGALPISPAELVRLPRVELEYTQARLVS